MKILLSSMYSVRSESSQELARRRMGPVTSTDKIGDSGEPCSVPRSGVSGVVV
jgi:hypothetical protein